MYRQKLGDPSPPHFHHQKMVKTSMLEPFFSGIDIGESSRGFSEIMGKRELQPKLNEKILQYICK